MIPGHRGFAASPGDLAALPGAHVPAAALHALGALGAFHPLAQGPCTTAALAAGCAADARGLDVVLELLGGLGLVERSVDGWAPGPQLAGALATAGGPARLSAALATAAATWDGAADPEVWVRDDLPARWAAAGPALAPVIHLAWGHLIAAALPPLAGAGLLRPDSWAPVPPGLARHADLAQRAGVLERGGQLVRLHRAAATAWGLGTAGTGWFTRRLRLDQDWFWGPLGSLTECLREGSPVTRSSAPGHGAAFRAEFTRCNADVAGLAESAARVAAAVHAPRRALRVLDVGAATGHWGVGFAAANAATRVVAVDASPVLAVTRQLVEAAGLGAQFTWWPNPGYGPPEGHYDVIVLNQICHTFGAAQLPAWLGVIVERLAPGGLLLVADLVLDDTRRAPVRHLASAVRLLVTGGGRVRSHQEYSRLFAGIGFGEVTLHRLAASDLLLVRNRDRRRAVLPAGGRTRRVERISR